VGVRGDRGLRWVVCAVGATLGTAAYAGGDRSLAELGDAYRTGDREGAVAEVALRGRESIERDVEQLASLASKSADRSTARMAVIVLLTESALREGRAGRFPGARWRLLGAARLVEAAPPTRDRAFERRFYLLAGLALHAGGDLQPGYTLVQKGLGIVPGDPELLTAQAAMIETVAALRRYDPSPDAHGREPPPGGYGTEIGNAGRLPNASLAEAATRYEEALALAPDLYEARLRLGRVRLLQGRPHDALPELDRVAADARQPGQRYLASLFAGRAWESRGDLQRAAAAYRAAAGQVPAAQSGLIALARALDRLGDAAGSQDTLDRTRDAATEDPWWDYQVGQPARLDALLAELRRLTP
jgi:hypothetical protein